MAEYWRRANQLVAKIAEGFSSKDCEKMCFIYDCVFSRSFRDKHGDNPLRLLEKMRDEKVFSNDKLDKLANLMEELDLPLLKSRVDAFVEENTSAMLQQRPLPAVPMNPVLCTSMGSSTSMEYTVPGAPCDPPNIPAPDGGYTHFFRQPSSVSRRTFASSRSSTLDSSSDGDGIYSEPYAGILQSTSQEHYPLHQERMKLLVKPMRDAMLAETERVITSEELKCSLPRSSYSLVITSGDRSSHPYVSANLYLLPGSHIEKEYFLLGKLQLRQRSKKQKQHQDIYSHSSLLNILPNSSVHSYSEPPPPIQEGTREPQPQTTPIGPIHVASFPSIISREHFLNEELVSRPYLTLVFTLKQYRPE